MIAFPRTRLEEALRDTGVFVGILVAWSVILFVLMALYGILELLLFDLGGLYRARLLVDMFEQVRRGLPLVIGYAALLNVVLYATVRVVRETIREWQTRDDRRGSADN